MTVGSVCRFGDMGSKGNQVKILNSARCCKFPYIVLFAHCHWL